MHWVALDLTLQLLLSSAEQQWTMECVIKFESLKY